jgi:hypothetical protein
VTKAEDKFSAKPSAATARKKASDRARHKLEAERWETSRYEWLNPPMSVVILPAPAAAPVPVFTPVPTPTPAPKSNDRKRPQGDRVQRSMLRLYGGVPARSVVKTAVAVRAIIEDLRAENKRLGVTLPDPSRPAIEQTLGRRPR